jgi:ketosteroid isomerase-like protein
MSQENVAQVRSGYEAFARGDVDAVLALLDPDIDWHPAIARSWVLKRCAGERP